MEKILQDEMRKKYAKIVAKAWADEDYKKNLIVNPNQVFKQEGIEIPEKIKINIFENTDKELNFALPVKPNNMSNIYEVEQRLAGMTILAGCCYDAAPTV